jgi:hypothetical protein
MVQAVPQHPPFNGTLESHRPHPGEDDPEREGCGERPMRPEAMVTYG